MESPLRALSAALTLVTSLTNSLEIIRELRQGTGFTYQRKAQGSIILGSPPSNRSQNEFIRRLSDEEGIAKDLTKKLLDPKISSTLRPCLKTVDLYQQILQYLSLPETDILEGPDIGADLDKWDKKYFDSALDMLQCGKLFLMDNAKKSPPPDISARIDASGGPQVNVIGDEPEDGQVHSAERVNEILGQAPPCVRNAYASYIFALGNWPDLRDETDKVIYAHLKDHGIDGFSKLEEYTMPSMDTWMRHLRSARQLLGEQKNSPRKGRPTGHSVVPANQI